MRISALVLLCLIATALGQTGDNFVVFEDTLHPDDALAFASLFDCTMQLMGYFPVFAITIREESIGGIFFVLTVGEGTVDHFQQWYFTGSERDWDCVFAAVNACAMVSKDTDWHSDWLQLNFENKFVSFTTSDCRDLFESLPGHSSQFILDQLEAHAYMNDVRD
jgi:hypothetical protein